MKKIIVALLLFAGSFAAEAQELVWETNVTKAMAISTETKKPLLLFFTGSDWCGWCIRLQKEVLKTPEFAAWAKENVVLVELDYPRKAPQTEEIKKQNNELQMAFGIQGFPTIILANASTKEGKVNFEGIGSTGYVAGGPSAWLAVANGFLKK
ncbi:thioredoxin family protein [Flavobacterium petrolei]|jgi:thioredoxin-related protein|uniref:Thioredoxin family protein n=1 Tax=Flavobacterium petrolei TaxID=2259594 RepID=A0A482TQ04_9FLAO|nr:MULTISPECIES: thioredoxin family protein [Flavobacterium]MDD2674077.1 thioredoxin family protein [Flavobacterium sp.]QIH39286.1 thioredoxin family protein [Flavobacterium sp. Sr18]RYJ53598.1 thioredoxin family protein [Flavobacterium petrolei]